MEHEIRWEKGWQVFQNGQLIPDAKVQQISFGDFRIPMEQGDRVLPGRLSAYVCLPDHSSPIWITPKLIRN